MKISYNWLKKFVDIKQSPQKLARDLSLFGHEVEAIKKIVYPDMSRAKSRDYILDFEITPNRGDCLSIFGMAREIAALYKLKIKNSRLDARQVKFKISESKINKKININIFNSSVCPRFTARIIDNIEVSESPKWLQDRLKSVGIRALNNIVDVTNYIMIETGQPLHAFDYDKIKNGQMNIRKAKIGESVVTLDGKDRKLDNDSIVIDDREKIYDLAGIMGGANSEVDKKTKTIILQGAIFDPILVRKTSKRLNLVSEASYRYERGVDTANTQNALDNAAELIVKLCPNAKIGELVDMETKKIESTKIKFTTDQINRLLGANITSKNMIVYLSRLRFKVIERSSDLMIATVPSYRAYDVKIWQDLAEEVARVYGYNNLHRCTDFTNSTNNAKTDEEFNKKEAIKDILVELDFNEIYSYSFVDRNLITRTGFDLANCQQVINGLSPETQYLRPSLLLSLITTVAKNPWAPVVNIFEIGKVFDKNGEKCQIGIAQVGKNPALIKTALEKLNINKPIESVDQPLLDYLKIRRQVKYVFLDTDDIKVDQSNYNNYISSIKYKDISQFPPTIRDLAFIVDKDINSDKILESIEKIDNHILLVELFDEFASDKFGINKKNIAYHIWLEDLDGPMKEKNIELITNKIIKIIEQKFEAKLRS